MDTQTAQALVRFGLGRRGDAALPADPRQWLLGQLGGPDPARIASEPSTAKGLAAVIADREQRRQARAATRLSTGTETPVARLGPNHAHEVYEADAKAELDYALTTPTPFRERLVWFWTNHFTVSIRQGGCQPLVGAFIEEAIRPHVTGPVRDDADGRDASPGDAAVSSECRIQWGQTVRRASARSAA